MDYQDIWIDCINKLEDLAYGVDDLSDNCIPSLPLSQDNVNGPVVLHVMNDIADMENILSGGKLMSVELTADDYLSFAFERGYLTYGDDATLNLLLAISFLIDELQMNRVVLYRRSQMKNEIISPNKNIPAIKQRILDLGNEVSPSCCTSCETALSSLYSFFETYNPFLLQQSDYTANDLMKLEQLNKMCEGLYHDKKTMMIQRLDVTIQSLMWDQKVEYDSETVVALRNEIDITRSCTVEQIFQARRSLLESICKVSTGNSTNKAKFRGIRIKDVPDRGGRVVIGAGTVSSTSGSGSNKRIYSRKSESERPGPTAEGFNETEKVIQVFGSAMSEKNAVRSSN